MIAQTEEALPRLAIQPGIIAPPAVQFRPILDYSVAHQIPGRVRLRVEAVRWDPALSHQIETFIGRQPGVRSARIARACASIVVEYDADAVSLTRVGAWLQEAPHHEAGPPPERTDRADAGSLVAGAAAVAIGITGVAPVAAAALVAVSAIPIVTRALGTAVRERRMNVDCLDATAVAVLVARGSIVAGALSSCLIAGGEFIRAHTARRSRVALHDLLASKDGYAWLVHGDLRERVPVEDLRPGQTVVVYPGDLVPADGIVIGGHALADEKTLTGESLPVLKERGSEVFASTSLVDGKLYVNTVRTGRSTRAQRVIDALASAPAHETAAANHAAAFADRLVVPTFGLAALVYALTRNVARTVSVLIFDLATGIRVSAPTTTLASMTAAAHRGIAVKSGAALEKLAAIDTVIFDKTGTLTIGTPMVTGVHAHGSAANEAEVLGLAAAVEQRLSHPVAQAVVSAAQTRAIDVPMRTKSHFKVGLGVRALVDGVIVRVGSSRYLLRNKIDVPIGIAAAVARAEERGQSSVIVTRDERVIGFICYADVPRPEAAATIACLRARGIQHIAMVTGDGERVARAVAGNLGIDDIYAEVFPEEKAEIVQQLQAQGRVVAVLGDGINDSAALAYADVSISIEGATDAARETADIVLHSGLGGLPDAMDLARETMGLIHENIRVVALPNIGGAALAVAGLIGPFASTAINNGSTIAAGLNSLRPLRRRDRAVEGGGP